MREEYWRILRLRNQIRCRLSAFGPRAPAFDLRPPYNFLARRPTALTSSVPVGPSSLYLPMSRTVHRYVGFIFRSIFSSLR